MAHFRPLNDMNKKLDVSLLFLIFVIAVSLRLRWIVVTGFNGLYGQDAYAYFDFAIELRHALVEWRVPAPFFWPLGYPSLLMLTFALFGASAGIGQMLNVLVGSLLPMLIYILARQCGSRWFGALIAGLLMAGCRQAIQSSIVLMADIPALFWATLSAVLLLFYVQERVGLRPFPTLRYVLVLSALCLTLAGITRWLYFVLAPVWTLLVLLHWRGRIRWRDSLRVLAVVLMLLLPQLAYSRTTPFPTFNHAWVVGWSPFNPLRHSFTNADGQFDYSYSNWRFYAAPLLDVYYLSPVFIPFVVIGLWALWLKRQNIFTKLMLLGWILLPYLFLMGIPYQNIRFPLIVFPPVAVLAGTGMDALWFFGEADRKNPVPTYALRFIAIMVLTIGIVHTLKTSETIMGTFINNQQQDKAIATWVNQQLPTDATLYTFGLTLVLQHETPFTIYELYYETPQSLDEKWIHGQTDYLLLNLWVIENQWKDREPYTAYHWLSDNRGLIRIGRYGNYTLFRIDG